MGQRRRGRADAPARERKVSFSDSALDHRAWVYETEEASRRSEGEAIRRAMAPGVLIEKGAEGARG